MPCNICDHTMENLGVEGQRIFWCPRCGTVKAVMPDGFENVSIPFWVRRAASCLIDGRVRMGEGQDTVSDIARAIKEAARE